MALFDIMTMLGKKNQIFKFFIFFNELEHVNTCDYCCIHDLMLHTSPLKKSPCHYFLLGNPNHTCLIKTQLLEKTMEHKKIPFKSPNKSPYKSFPKNPRMIRKF